MFGSSFRDDIERGIRQFHPEAELLWVKALAGGMSAAMTAFEVEHSGGRREKLVARRPSAYRFRQNPEAARWEFQILEFLRATGLPTPNPRFVVEATPPFFVVDYIEGSVDIDPKDRSAYLERYVDQLVQIHRVDLTVLDLGRLPIQGRGYGPPRSNLNESLRESEIRAALDSVRDISRSNASVLRHGDFWPGNVLWRDGKIVGVIDWEEILVGEPLADVAVCRLDIWWVFGEAGCDEFTRLYRERMPLDYTDLPYSDLCASLRPISNIEEWAPGYNEMGRPDVTEATMRRDHQGFVERALREIQSNSARHV